MALARILGMQSWDDPRKYLGLPAQWGRSKTAALSWIKDRILAKLEGWKENLLNMAGKEVLIKSVIQAIPTYAMAIIRFPKTFCQNICSIIANFWWSGNGRGRGIHWKSWRYISTSRKEGGMGFKDFSFMNSAHLGKQAWRTFQQPDALWVKFLKGLYFPTSDFMLQEKGIILGLGLVFYMGGMLF